MEENRIIVDDKKTIKRSYLKIAGAGKLLPAIIVAAVVICAAVWLFAGRMTVNVSGYCEPSETSVVFMLPMYYRNEVKPGDEIWVGNHRGTIENLFGDSYFTYEDLCNSDDLVFRNFLNSGKCSEDMSYILGSAVFEEKISGITDYRIVTGTAAPYQVLTGMVEHGR